MDDYYRSWKRFISGITRSCRDPDGICLIPLWQCRVTGMCVFFQYSHFQSVDYVQNGNWLLFYNRQFYLLNNTSIRISTLRAFVQYLIRMASISVFGEDWLSLRSPVAVVCAKRCNSMYRINIKMRNHMGFLIDPTYRIFVPPILYNLIAENVVDLVHNIGILSEAFHYDTSFFINL